MLMKYKGVSLLETVVAAAILSGAVMTVCGLSAKGLRSIREGTPVDPGQPGV
jgi:predicted peroxiredoxin